MFKFSKSHDDSPVRIALLIRGALKQDKRAFKDLFDIFSGKMYSLCLRYTGNRHDADEAFQDGLLKLYRSLDDYSAADSFENWVRKIFVDVCIVHVTKKETVSDADSACIQHTIDINADGTIEQSALHSFIVQLPVSYRLIANLCLIEQYEYRESWKMLGISESTGSQLLSKVVMLLKKNNAY